MAAGRSAGPGAIPRVRMAATEAERDGGTTCGSKNSCALCPRAGVRESDAVGPHICRAPGAEDQHMGKGDNRKGNKEAKKPKKEKVKTNVSNPSTKGTVIKDK